MTTSSILLLCFIALLAVCVLFYNRLVALRQTALRSFADVDVQLKQRADLVPNLVETVKGYAGHENEIFTKVTEARASAMKATETNLADRVQAETALSGALVQLMAVAENYPDLKANENFKQLQTGLGDLENKIAASRRFYNNAVTEYNTAIAQFPSLIIARLFAFVSFDLFDLGDTRTTVETPPNVSFNK